MEQAAIPSAFFPSSTHSLLLLTNACALTLVGSTSSFNQPSGNKTLIVAPWDKVYWTIGHPLGLTPHLMKVPIRSHHPFDESTH